MRYLVVIALLLVPSLAFASCSPQGATVIYVNGILTSSDDANEDLKKLREEYQRKTNDYETKFYNGYNPSHLGGLGDLLKSIQQAYQGEGKFIEDTDLKTILLQIHPHVTTQKILLVGHSQGAYYTNAMYEYLTKHGVSENSIAVYNVATPTSFIAGDGQYLTSATDKVINKVRSAIKSAPSVESFGAGAALATVEQTRPKDPLPPNTSFILDAKEEADEKGGHSFSGVYLKNAPNTIVSAIRGDIVSLTPAADSEGDCFASPAEDAKYKAGKANLAMLDFAVEKAGPVLAFVRDFAVDVGQKVPSNMAAAANSLVKVITPQARTTNLPGSHSIVDALYGSSVKEKQLRELLGDSQGGAVALAVKKPEIQKQKVEIKPVQEGEIKGIEIEKTEILDEGPPAAPQEPLIPPPLPPTAGGGGISPGFGGGTPTPAVEAAVPASEPVALFNASTTPPTLSVTDCGTPSISPCYVSLPDMTLVWNAVTAATEYAVKVDGSIFGATTTALTANLSLPVGATSTLAVVAYDSSGASLISNAIEVFVSPPAPAYTAVLGQTNLSVLGQTQQSQGILPGQRLGNGLTSTVGSVVYKMHGTDLAALVTGAGWGYTQLFDCMDDNGSYFPIGFCQSVSSGAGQSPQIISQTGDDATVLVVMPPYTFTPHHYYWLRFIITGDMALYGSSADMYGDPETIGAWVGGSDFVGYSADANGIVDWGFRICSTATCDF